MKLEPQRQHLACLGTWILYHNLRIMIQYLLSGFELELYSMHEYYYIYWYDTHGFTDNKQNTMHRLKITQTKNAQYTTRIPEMWDVF